VKLSNTMRECLAMHPDEWEPFRGGFYMRTRRALQNRGLVERNPWGQVRKTEAGKAVFHD